MKIAYCQCTFARDFERTVKCVELMAPYVDMVIIVADQTVSEEDVERLKKIRDNVHVIHTEFPDDIPKFRNKYMAYAELNDVDFAKDLREIVEELEAKGYNIAGINCHEQFEDIEWLDELDLLKECPGGYRESNFYKNLLFKLRPGLRYRGVGIGRVHETWNIQEGWKAVNLPKEKYWYTHTKSALDIWRNAARNVVLGGGGDNVGEINPYWKPLRELMSKHGIKDWTEFERKVKEKQVPRELSLYILSLLEAPNNDWGRECRQLAKWFLWYNREYLTPEVEDKIKNPPPPTKEQMAIDAVRKIYFQVLGRHPDREGLEHYTKMVLEGKVKLEDLPRLFKLSPEYMEKFGAAPPESVRMQIPVHVDIGVTPEVFVEAMKRSTVFWEQIKPLFTLARKFEAYLAIQKKAETGGRGVDEEPVETFTHYVEKIKQIMPPDKYPRILEIGAGSGSETKALMDAGYDVTGITFGKDNIRYAKEKHGIDLLEMDMHNLEFPEGFFDGVAIIHTFEHALAPHMVVGEIRYVLKNGGRVYLVVPDAKEKTIWHTNLLYPDQIKALFEYWGFRDLKETELKNRDGWSEWEFAFEKLPNDHPSFKHNWGYIQHIYRRRPK